MKVIKEKQTREKVEKPDQKNSWTQRERKVKGKIYELSSGGKGARYSAPRLLPTTRSRKKWNA